MKLSIQRDALLKALQKICGVTSSRTTRPEIANVLMEAGDGALRMTGTDLDMHLSCEVAAETREPGATALPARRLLGIVSKLEDEKVLLRSGKNHHADIECGTASYTLLGFDPESFPRAGDFAALRSVKVAQAVLGKLLDRTSYAAGVDDSRKPLQGVLLSVKEGLLVAAATDGKRLAVAEAVLDGASGHDGDIVIPHKCATELEKVLMSDGEALLEIGERQFRMKAGSVQLSSRLIEGSYPNFKQSVPAAFSLRAEAPCKAFVGALERVVSPLSEGLQSVRLSLSPGRLSFDASSAGIGSARESISIDYSGPELSASFNPKFLEEPFKALDVEKVAIKLNDASSPVAVESSDGFLYIIMPMRAPGAAASAAQSSPEQ